MITKLFTIEVLSNLHVGNGEINYGLIDNLIQRDPVTEQPNINSSSLKGALREYFKHLEEEKTRKGITAKWTVEKIFGSDPKEKDNRKQGSVRFFEAELLVIPVRCNDKPYKMVTSKDTIEDFKEKMKSFGIVVTDDKVKKVFGPLDNVLESYEDFKNYCSNDELPVISRNNLENGQSSNLWYEQVLPRHSRLAFVVMGNESDDFNEFCKALNNSVVQIGANATIGYGYCKITEVC